MRSKWSLFELISLELAEALLLDQMLDEMPECLFFIFNMSFYLPV